MGRPGLLGTMARTAVITKTATTVAGNSAAKQAANAPAPAAVAPAADDVMTQITKLGELKAAGLIDDAEFAAAKAKILGI
jgi:membrane protease subunit (stomatin/prohibitin family)